MEKQDRVNREGWERLYPAVTNPNWLVLRKRREIFRKWVERLPGRDFDVVDVGGRLQPYRSLLQGRIRTYIAVDMQRAALVNVVGRGEQIPLANARFDLAICTQMLEYSQNPAAVIAEMYRLLKPCGVVMLSVPSVSPQDSEIDRWRFLPAALRQLLEGFEQVEIVAEGGSIVGLFRAVNACLNIFARHEWIRFLFRCSLFPVINVAGLVGERIADSGNIQFAANYSAYARKPESVRV